MRGGISRAIALLATVAVAGGISLVSSGVALGSAPTQPAGIAPNRVNELDCNGFSPVYKSVKMDLGGLCTDPLTPPGAWSAHAGRFYDNGHYIGHDEPSVKFISTAPGTADNMTYFMKLPVDPTATPTANAGANTTDYAELSPAPWFGLPICDPLSYPINPCTPQSDSNGGAINDPAAAGSAFMELQFYPPGFPPFVDAPSCDQHHWCAALTIDSLEATYGFSLINNSCVEPVNFAFISTTGTPAGPPSPQLADLQTFIPNSNTLLMSQGDTIKVSIRDVPVPAYSETVNHHTYTVPAGLALKATVDDLTTGVTGTMTASAANGFMDTQGIIRHGQSNSYSLGDCSGVPFNFTAEYSSASEQNQVPWAALQGGVLMEDEIGHFEACSSVANQMPSGTVFGDTVYQSCVGGSEGTAPPEQGCSLTTFNCPGATTQDGLACPPDLATGEPNAAEGLSCEYSDAICLPAGTRTVSNDGDVTKVSWPVAGCQDDFFQNGDLDFDGTPYQNDWPNGSATTPTSFQYWGPFSNGSTYPSVQFETDVLASEGFCNVTTALGCTVPPVGANFYPFWTLGSSSSEPTSAPTSFTCAWNFGNTLPNTVNSEGGDSEYGSPNLARYAGTSISAPEPNPQLSSSCGS
jgi:hypothetical protein